MHALAEPWSQAFLQRAFLELALVRISGGALGCWIVFYELSYSAESLAHALFPGLVGAALLGLPLVAGGAVGVAGAAAAVAIFGRTPAIGRDTSVAVVITSLFGLGVLLALSPASFGIFLGVFVVTVALTRYISLGSTLGAVAFAVALARTGNILATVSSMRFGSPAAAVSSLR